MSKITCQICGEMTHSVQLHLRESHPDWTVDTYQLTYPDAPLLSPVAEAKIAAAKRGGVEAMPKAAMAASTAEVVELRAGPKKAALHEVFELGKVKAAMNRHGNPIMIQVQPGSGEDANMIPDVDAGYVFDIEVLKSVIMGLELNIPTYVWGYHGTGKTSLYEQICARTNRPMIRVQHTANTEEAHIVGEKAANESGTYFDPGFLPLAMRHGWIYLADEYDYAHPSINSVYQAVLEGKPLVIKEAPPEWRVVRPHPNFRFVATGNTNGAGDDSGLYSGTVMGNAANYSRFGITVKMPYMPAKQEELILRNKAELVAEDAKLLVKFANKIRDGFEKGNIGMTLGPRELIFAGMVGARRGSFTLGLRQAFINRLNEVDREAAEAVAQRIFSEVAA